MQNLSALVARYANSLCHLPHDADSDEKALVAIAMATSSDPISQCFSRSEFEAGGYVVYMIR